MSIATEITRLQTAKADLKTAIEGKGVTVSSATLIDGYADLVESIETGGGSEPSLNDFLAEAITAFRITDSRISTPRTKLQNYFNQASLFITRSAAGQNGMFSASRFTSIVFDPPSLQGTGTNFNSSNTYLTICDIGDYVNAIGNNAFLNDSNLKTLILRRTSLLTCSSNSFSGTPAASGGSGMTIYIPKTLYDALGTGTNDYKAATNWATYDGYGTITWAAIEGSQYENYYADGTPISS